MELLPDVPLIGRPRPGGGRASEMADGPDGAGIVARLDVANGENSSSSESSSALFDEAEGALNSCMPSASQGSRGVVAVLCVDAVLERGLNSRAPTFKDGEPLNPRVGDEGRLKPAIEEALRVLFAPAAEFATWPDSARWKRLGDALGLALEKPLLFRAAGIGLEGRGDEASPMGPY